jgi:uncharacterized protein YybS (DUF2232 family)
MTLLPFLLWGLPGSIVLWLLAFILIQWIRDELL